MLHGHGPWFKLWSISLQWWESMLSQTLHVDSSSSYHRLTSTLSWVGDTCSLGGVPSFCPAVLKARELNYSWLIFEENRLCKAVVASHASPALASSSGDTINEKILMVVGIETRTILVTSNEVEVYRSTFYISRLPHIAKTLEYSYIIYCEK